MTWQQILALVMPPILVGVMIPTFALMSRRLGNQAGWFTGLVLYWLVWGGVVSLIFLGRDGLLALIVPRQVTIQAVLLTTVPIVFAAVMRFGMGLCYDKPTRWVAVGLIVTALGNGFFEEVIWRGVFLLHFSGNYLWGVLYPSLWFGLWHVAPGRVSGGSAGVWRLVVGAVFLGLVLGFTAQQTGSIGWSILAHTLAGLIMVW